jgi:negative regulator of sigma E activity
VNWNFQPGIHPDADQLSVFVEGATTAREQERMLSHLAECAECRTAVFLMQPHAATHQATATPVKGWSWRWLVPVGVPAAALACVLIAVLIHIRRHGGASEVLQQNARVNQPEIQLPRTSVAPTLNSESTARSENPKSGVTSNAAPANLSRQVKRRLTDGLDLSKSKSNQMAANVEPPRIMAPAPSPVTRGGPVGSLVGSAGRAAGSAGGISGGARGAVLGLQTSQAAAQNSLPQKKDLPTFEGFIEQDATLAGVSGRITDRSGAVVAGVTITLRDASGKTRQTTTGADGSFHLPELPAGQYELTAAASGFETRKQSIELKPSELAMLQPVLDAGKASEAVEVAASGAAQTVQTESADMSGVVTEKEATNLALNGRNFTQLVTLSPGVTTLSHGKRLLSLDNAGNLSLSRDKGKKWKKINPQWAGKAVRIELTSAQSSDASTTAQNETGPASQGAVFRLTTDAGAVWTSKDGAHWHQQ